MEGSTPLDELAGFLSGNAATSISPQNPLGENAEPSANPSNPNMNPNNPGAWANPSNPALNPNLPGAVTNPSNPKYNPGMPGAVNNPSNYQYNTQMPGSMTNPANPKLNPAYPGSVMNPANPIHNPNYPVHAEIPRPPGLSENASLPPAHAAWREAASPYDEPPLYGGEWPEIRQHIAQKPWVPGTYGKGFITPFGRPISWQVERKHNMAESRSPSDLWPAHADGMTAAGYPPGKDWLKDGLPVFQIDKEGGIWHSNEPESYNDAELYAHPTYQTIADFVRKQGVEPNPYWSDLEDEEEEDPWHTERAAGWREAGAYDYYYHVSPRGNRERIQQHGLHPHGPDHGNFPVEILDNPDNPKMVGRPEGVYVTKSPRGAINWRGVVPRDIGSGDWGVISNGNDIWRIPRSDVNELVPDPVERNAWYVPHHIPSPELWKPDQSAEDSMWMDHQDYTGESDPNPYGWSYDWQIKPEWGIGKPNRVWGKTADADTGDSREWPDPTEPRASAPPVPHGCTCRGGTDSAAKLHCPIHGLDGQWERAMDWSIPEGQPIGYPEDQPRGWVDAVHSSAPKLPIKPPVVKPRPSKFHTGLKQHEHRKRMWHWFRPKQGMISPETVQAWIERDRNSPYLYHSTTPEAAQSILQEGLYPFDELGTGEPTVECPNCGYNEPDEDYEGSSIGQDCPACGDDYLQAGGPSPYAGQYYEPRPGHVYLGSHDMVSRETQATRRGNHMIRVDIRKLDPTKINADEDAFNPNIDKYRYSPIVQEVIHDEPQPDAGSFGEHGMTYGQWAERARLGENPEETHHSLFNHGSIAYNGVIPPEAIELADPRTGLAMNDSQVQYLGNPAYPEYAGTFR